MHDPDSNSQWSRRQFLTLGSSCLALGLVGSVIPVAAPWAAQTAASPELEIFMSLSERLTGRDSLNRDIGERLFSALTQQSPDFSQRMRALSELWQQQPGLTTDNLLPTLQPHQPELADIPKLIAAAWYLGQVGGNTLPQSEPEHQRASKEPVSAQTVVVTYEQALMFEPVRDVLTIPSYCRDVPGYWANKPA